MIIAEFHDVLTAEECQALIDHGSKSLKALTVIGTEEATKFRVGDGTWVYGSVMSPNGTDLNAKLKGIASKWSGLPVENQESIHIVRYGVGGEYKDHHDFFHRGHDYERHLGRAGQRTHTVLFYLNEGFEGGETRFSKKNVSVTAKLGKMLMWTNLKEDGEPDQDSLHAGLPVKAGVKWIAIVWVRQNKFG